MADFFLGEIRVMSFAWPPKGWAHCNGQLLPINQNQALYALLGSTYGGDGRVNFALPNLQGRVPLHVGGGRGLGNTGGAESHTLSAIEMPTHHHAAMASRAKGDTTIPGSGVLASASGLWGGPSQLTTLEPASVTSAGAGQPHDNRQPYLPLNFCIALQGPFPSQN